MSSINQLFFELIQVSLGTRICLSHTPSADEWGELYAMAKKQSLVGVCFAGVQKLQTQRQEPPEMLYLTWMGMAAKIQQRNDVVNKQCVELQEKLSADGFRSCILKGQGVGALYGSLSMLRQSGDIDVWIDADRDKVIDYVKLICPDDDVDISGKHIEFCLFNDTIVEAHFMPASTKVPVIGNRVKSFYNGVKDIQMVNKIVLDSKFEIVAPTPSFQAIHILHHAFSHFLFEGIGMRQLMDYYFVMKQSFAQDEQDNVITTLKHLELWRFAQGVSYVCNKVFGLNVGFIPGDKKLGNRILRSIMKEGNFGMYDNHRDDNRMGSSWYRFWYHNARLINFFDVAPWFIIMSPFSRIHEYVWRWSNGYFKK